MKPTHVLQGALLFLALSYTGCGDNSDPDPVDVKNLKYPSNLRIQDNGDGTAKLTWQASNFEGDFEGYNVYGVKMDDDTISTLSEQGLAKGTPLQLLDSDGDASGDAKAVLSKFNYDFDTPLNAAKEVVDDDGNRKISFLPIHNRKAANADPVLPTCYPTTTTNNETTCTPTEETSDTSDASANGTVAYTVSGMTAGSQYCFLVFSVQDDGEEISQSSSNFECFTPKIKSVGFLTLTPTAASTSALGKNPRGENISREFKIRDFATACQNNNGACPSSTVDTYYAADTGDASLSSTGDIYLETFASNTDVNFTPGKDCGILNMGYSLGHEDTTLPTEAPSYDNSFSDGTNNVQNSNGYSVAGQSILLVKNNMYILACTDSSDSTKVYYDWIWVKGTDPGTGTYTNPQDTDASGFEVDMRLSVTSR